MKDRRGQEMNKYWYMELVEFCPVCGSETRWKQRSTAPRPFDRQDRVYAKICYDNCLDQ